MKNDGGWYFGWDTEGRCSSEEHLEKGLNAAKESEPIDQLSRKRKYQVQKV